MAQVDSEDSTAAPAKPKAEAPTSVAGELYFPTDISPEDLLDALERIRRQAKNEINRLIDLLDRTDAFYDEREGQVDDEPIDGDADSEESLGSIDAVDQTRWASGEAGDREGDGCADDREGDELQHGGDGAIEDNEPSLGWTEDRQVMGGSPWPYHDLEIAPSTVTAAARGRYRKSNRYVANEDGQHVDSERMFGPRRIRNLSGRQRQLIGPKIDRSQVSC